MDLSCLTLHSSVAHAVPLLSVFLVFSQLNIEACGLMPTNVALVLMLWV
jgi:hypothetical protein